MTVIICLWVHLCPIHCTLPTLESGTQWQWPRGIQLRKHSQHKTLPLVPLIQLLRYPMGVVDRIIIRKSAIAHKRKPTWCPPATSTKTAKLVRWLLTQWTAVVFPLVVTLTVWTPTDDQWPLPILMMINYSSYTVRLIGGNSRMREVPVCTDVPGGILNLELIEQTFIGISHKLTWPVLPELLHLAPPPVIS